MKHETVEILTMLDKLMLSNSLNAFIYLIYQTNYKNWQCRYLLCAVAMQPENIFVLSHINSVHTSNITFKYTIKFKIKCMHNVFVISAITHNI